MSQDTRRDRAAPAGGTHDEDAADVEALALLDGAADEHGVRRSLHEDLAVAHLRALSACERSSEVVQRARAAAARVAELEREVEQLGAALRSRPAIEHVVGMVMLVRGCDADEAFGLLVEVSQRSNVKLREVAAALAARVAAGQGLPEEFLRVVAGPPRAAGLSPRPAPRPGRRRPAP
ncbi:ANTAR domain-containing protein [Kineococcus terrestris]|uniref:ANTAR domain-containing protein n=1 Tax=Kineococcus terrestris TaxID=2044856 RepID=UPI0034DB4071